MEDQLNVSFMSAMSDGGSFVAAANPFADQQADNPFVQQGGNNPFNPFVAPFIPQPQPQFAAAATPVDPAAAARRVRLPSFWVSAPVQWFAAAETQFRLYGVDSSVDRFNLAVAALPEAVARQSSHLLIDPPQLYPYEELRHHLTTHHELSNYEKVERIVKADPLGARKPSEMLAAMMEFVPKGDEKSTFLAYFFLQRLPAEVRVLLSEDDHTDLRTLAARADRLMAHSTTSVGGVVAAVKPAYTHQQQSNQHKKKGGKAKTSTAAAMPPTAVAQVAVGMCWYHWKHGENAQKCEKPCSWVGN